jgi:hypothetical protein
MDFSLEEFGDHSRHFGITLKPFISALAPGTGPNHGDVVQSFAGKWKKSDLAWWKKNHK